MKKIAMLVMVVGMLGGSAAQAAPSAPSQPAPTAKLLLGNMSFQLFSDWSACMTVPGAPIIVGTMTAQGGVFGTSPNVAWIPDVIFPDGGTSRCAISVLTPSGVTNAEVTYTFVGTTYTADKPLEVECHQVSKIGQFSPVCQRLTP